MPDINTPPQQFVVSEPEQMSLSELSEYISSSTASPEHLAAYRTEWWYRVMYPFSLIILMLFALLQGTRTDRRSPVVGIVWAIVALIAYTLLMNGFMTLGPALPVAGLFLRRGDSDPLRRDRAAPAGGEQRLVVAIAGDRKALASHLGGGGGEGGIGPIGQIGPRGLEIPSVVS